VEDNFDLSGVLEFTVEAGRPDSITREKLQVLRGHPVTRISVNPQTMNQKTLDLIGRRHTVEDTVRAFETARALGFDNINMDLIVGLPGEGLEEVTHTMQMIEAMDPDDVTVHALALKRAARLALHMDEYEKISFNASDRIMELCEEACGRLGMSPYYLYRQKNMAGNYENVGYAKSGKAGLYNILIMEEVECILALGASGSTKIVTGDGRIERIENVKDIRNYLDRIDEMIGRKMASAPVYRH
jgi:oxygen-independent coproporphyrinogen-3 oxidase